MTLRIAFAHNFHDRDWLGGKNYFASLFTAIQAIGRSDIEWSFVTGEKTETSLPDEFPWLKLERTELLDRLAPAWAARQLTLRTTGTDPLLHRYLAIRGVALLSHSGPLIKVPRVKCLPWLYDFQFMHLPEYWDPKHISWATKRYNAACRLGDGILVSSVDAQKDLEKFAPWCVLPKHVLRFVSNPVDFDRLPTLSEITTKYALPDNYLYLPNQFWANKNHSLVIEALARLRSAGQSVTVACTGKTVDGRLPEYFDGLLRRRDVLNVTEQFKVLGVVPYGDLQGLMAHSNAVINPSRFEGWSTTVEEAKTLQRPLLLSNIGVHREQSPALGRFFDVTDDTTLADLMLDASRHPPPTVSRQSIQADYTKRLTEFGAAYLAVIGATLSRGQYAR